MVRDFFREILGQTQAIDLLVRAMEQERIPPAYLFSGRQGIGKATTAKAWIRAIVGRVAHPDVLWVEPTYLDRGKLVTSSEATNLKRKTSPQVRLEQVREVSEFLSRLPLQSPRSIVVIENAETMAESASNALLKTLEEPGRATIILLVTAGNHILPTLISRCQKISFWGLSLPDMETILRKQGVTDMPQAILEQAEGSVGLALQAYEILQNTPPELLPCAENLPQRSIDSLQMAKSIASLELETQLWLADYWQQWLWQSRYANQDARQPVQDLEQAKQYLKSFVQPRLVWEVTLSRLAKSL